jgi:hypothetical protein
MKPPITLLLRGESGSGKTFKAAQFPKPFIISLDANTRCLEKLPQVQRSEMTIVDPKFRDGKKLEAKERWDSFVATLEKACESASRTIVIDSLTTLSSLMEQKILGTNNPLVPMQIAGWGSFSRFFDWLGDEFLCNSALDKNIIFIVHEHMHIDEVSKAQLYTLALSTKVKDTFVRYFTDCWRCSVLPGKPIPGYAVEIYPTRSYLCKCSLASDGLLSPFVWDKDKDKLLSQIE